VGPSPPSSPRSASSNPFFPTEDEALLWGDPPPPTHRSWLLSQFFLKIHSPCWDYDGDFSFFVCGRHASALSLLWRAFSPRDGWSFFFFYGILISNKFLPLFSPFCQVSPPNQLSGGIFDSRMELAFFFFFPTRPTTFLPPLCVDGSSLYLLVMIPTHSFFSTAQSAFLLLPEGSKIFLFRTPTGYEGSPLPPPDKETTFLFLFFRDSLFFPPSLLLSEIAIARCLLPFSWGGKKNICPSFFFFSKNALYGVWWEGTSPQYQVSRVSPPAR